MRVLFDIVHPAHVHFFRHMIASLEGSGDETLVIARDKDVTLDLLRSAGIPHETIGRSGATGYVGQARELAQRVAHLVRRGREFRPDVVATRNPAGVQAARLLRVPGVFDTDNGTSAGIHFRAAAPFATVITTPACLTEDFGRKHRRYAGYKPMAFLHPDVFEPDESVHDAMGIPVGTPYSIVRLVAMDASHDHHQRGVPLAVAEELVEALERHGRVFVSTEGPLPPQFEDRRFPAPPDRMLDALAFASLLVGDSGSMAVEAAVLGTPNVFFSSFARRLEYLNDLEDRYELSVNLAPTQTRELVEISESLVRDPTVPDTWAGRRAQMLSETVNVSEWFVELLRELGER